jgi:glycosyltransferase involved in cell wall biosynthesis
MLGQAVESGAVTPLADTGRQPFMSKAMWFAWLLRADVRGGAQPGNAAAQREFVAWWILTGPYEYPNVWSISDAAIEVAMEPVYITPTQRMPRLLRELYRRRPDLQRVFPLVPGGDAGPFFSWYRVCGAQDLLIAPKLPPMFEKVTEQPATSAPWRDDIPSVPWIAATFHQLTEAAVLQFNVQDRQARQRYAEWFTEVGVTLLPPPRTTLPAPPPLQALPQVPGFGVNLVGYPRGEFGIGEDIRSMSAAFKAADIPHVVIDLKHGSLARQQDDTLAAQIGTELVYGITIFCQSAFDMARVYLERGPAMFGRGIVIGNWPWELARFPACWSDVYSLVTEVWAASKFTLGAYEADVGDRACLLPPAVSIEPMPVRDAPATPVPPNRPYTFFCAFDPNSSIERKNPIATIRAFRRAFPSREEAVRLVLRVNGAPAAHSEWPHVMEEIGDDARIDIREGTLSRSDFLKEMRDSDCVVSSHRAEGFGRNIAEAILMGVHVLATGYSGCMDFLHEPETIPYTTRSLNPPDYPYGNGLEWADPDVSQLAERMRHITTTSAPDPDRARELGAVYSVEAAGKRYRTRLNKLYQTKSPPERQNAPPRRVRLVT